MKIVLEHSDDELEILIKGDLGDPKVQEIIAKINSIKKANKLVLYKDDKEYLCQTEEVSYFSCGNNKVYAYIGKEIYETKQKLYEIAKQLENKPFIQISKSVIVNLDCIRSVEAEFSGNYIAMLKDEQTKLVISRSYMKSFRKKVLED